MLGLEKLDSFLNRLLAYFLKEERRIVKLKKV